VAELLHNALKRSPIADGIKKAIGQHKQGEGGLERWSETLQGIVNVWGLPEWAFLRGERLGAVKAVTTLVAAEFGIVGIGNPIASDAIVVVETVSVSTPTAMTCQLEVVAHTAISGTVVSTTGMASGRDRRFLSPGGRTFMVAGTDAGSSFGIPLEQRLSLTNQFVDFNCLPVVLKPGDDLVIVGQTVNITINSNWSWRERKAFPGELA